MISGFSSHTTRLSALILTLACAVPTFAQSTRTANAPQTQPAATRPSFPPIAAVINNENLSRDDFQTALEMAAGPRVFNEILTMVVAKQACERAGIAITPEKVKAQLERVYSGLRASGVPEDRLEQALAVSLQQRGVTRFEFEWTLTRMACLAEMAKNSDIKIGDDKVDEAFKIQNGVKYNIIDFPLPDQAAAAKLRGLIEKDKKSPEDAAREIGSNAQLVTLSEFADMSQPATKKAMDLIKDLKPGQLSAFVNLSPDPAGQAQWHMLYLKGVDPAREVKAADVAAEKAKLKQQLQQAAELEWANNHLNELVRKASVQIHDPVLQQIYQQIDAARAAQAAAATQAATQPATSLPTTPR